VEKGSLSVVTLWMLAVPLKAQTDDPPISGGCYVISHQPSPFSSFSPYLEYSRRGMIVWEITPTSAIDFDITPCGWEENPVVIIGWTDFGAGGEFGYSLMATVSIPSTIQSWRTHIVQSLTLSAF